MKNYNVSSIQQQLNGVKSALIVCPQLSIDTVAAALALALTLKDNQIDAKVFCPQKPDNNYSKLSGLDLITQTKGDNNLTITINHPLDQIDQVSYNDDNGKLNLIVKTKPGSSQIDNNNIDINNQSNSYDIAFMLGDESALGQQSDMVSQGNWIYISPQDGSKSWAKASLIDRDAPFCEIFTFLLPMLNWSLSTDAAKNLLIGLRVATQSFSVNVSPETFEAGAICLKATQSNGQSQTSNSDSTPIEKVESAPASKFQPSQSQKPSSLPTT